MSAAMIGELDWLPPGRNIGCRLNIHDGLAFETLATTGALAGFAHTGKAPIPIDNRDTARGQGNG